MEEKYHVNQTSISSLLTYVENGTIAIPEIQRPYVWSTTQVRNLIDSLYQGFPVGYIITWQNPDVRLKDGSVSHGKTIIIDGQQRITALRAALAGQEIVDKKYNKKTIKISFNPLTEEFKTQTGSTKRGGEWIADIAEVMTTGWDTLSFIRTYCEKNEGADERVINNRILKLIQIKNRQIGDIRLSADLDINIVNEIFVRINASGVSLSNADFAMSKIAVYEKELGDEFGVKLRKFIDYFAHIAANEQGYNEIASNDTHFTKTDYFQKIAWLRNDTDDLYDPDYNDIIRVVGLTEFERGGLGDIVALLSGRNFETRRDEKEIADQSFEKLERGVYKFTNENRFKQFVQSVLRGSGHDDTSMLGARNAVNYAYAFYIRLHDIGENHAVINELVRKLFVISLLTARHSGSFETRFETDIKRLKKPGDMEAFIHTIETQALTDVYWTDTLVDELDKVGVNNPFWHLFIAAQNKLTKQSFLSKGNKVWELATDDIHHIFPKNYLVKKGYDKSQYNKIANFVHLRNDINIAVGDKEPREYIGNILENGVGKYHSDIDDKAQLFKNFSDNAIPEMLLTATSENFDEFLAQRRQLMAGVIKDYYHSL